MTSTERIKNKRTAATVRLMALWPLAIRSVFGGILMGLANLVPGISGGTMLLAAGIYPPFIEAVANVTRFRFRLQGVVVLACVAGSAGIAILLLAGMLKDLVVDYRWVMYSLFIGLTLGGIPVVWRMVRPATASLYYGAMVAFMAMCTLATLQALGVVGQGQSNFITLFLAGLVGASAMILPGLSGGYLLLLLGQYVPILSAIDQVKEALKSRDIAALMPPVLHVVLPVGLGVVCGIVVVGNLLQWMMRRSRQATFGLLLGLLLGSVVGLYPFVKPTRPEIGMVIKGTEVNLDNLDHFLADKDDWPVVYFPPTLGQCVGSLALVTVGFLVTTGVAKIGGSESGLDNTERD